jgi:hypothetical protein
MFGFLFGAVAGALAVTYWCRGLDTLETDRLSKLRHQVADRLEASSRALVRKLDAVSATAASLVRGTRGTIVAGSQADGD